VCGVHLSKIVDHKAARWQAGGALLRFGHHHLAELVKVHGTAAVFVQLFNDTV
jgi:hypothetical protein